MAATQQTASLTALISEVSINVLPNPQGKTLAFARVVLAELLVLNDLKVVEGSNGLFVSMPQRFSEASNQYFDYYNPITAPARAELQSAVLEAYQAEQERLHPPVKPPARPPARGGGGGRGR